VFFSGFRGRNILHHQIETVQRLAIAAWMQCSGIRIKQASIPDDGRTAFIQATHC